jgi:hypothetical protein
MLSKKLMLKKTLKDFDEFYKNIISTMPNSCKINYCESLVYRTSNDIELCDCKTKIIKLKNLLEVSKIELEKLQHKNDF